MKKLRLDLDALVVESFPLREGTASSDEGTVRAHGGSILYPHPVDDTGSIDTGPINCSTDPDGNSYYCESMDCTFRCGGSC